MKATRDFNERYQGMKEYKKGDTYSNSNKDRVAFLLENGYLEESKEVKDLKKDEEPKLPKEKKEKKTPTKKKGD